LMIKSDVKMSCYCPFKGETWDPPPPSAPPHLSEILPLSFGSGKYETRGRKKEEQHERERR
jgi:hypothetical protein